MPFTARRPGVLRAVAGASVPLLPALALTASALAAWLLPVAARAADLTPVESTWLKAAWPVVTWAKQAGLPLDLVVQPQDAPEAAPLSMAWVDGRCKLVLSMRGNPEAQATLDRLPADLREAGVQMMAAHELAHCHRHVDGAWAQVPAGVVLAPAPAVLDAQDAEAWRDMKATRREEGYADLVGLAWVHAHQAALYPRLQAWLIDARRADHDQLPGSGHDTMAWVRLAPTGREFATGDLFAGAEPLWTDGLSRPE